MKSQHHRKCPVTRAIVTTWVVLSGILAGCGGSADSAARQDEGVPVEVVLVQPASLRETVRGIGTLRAAETVEIKPEMDGIVREIHFEEGGKVGKEQLLFLIDDDKLTHQLAARKAALETARVHQADAERRFNRVKKLLERNAADQDEIDETETYFRAAVAEVIRMEAEVELVQAQLDDTRIRAPFDGVISERYVDVGDYVQDGDHLATLYRVSQMEIAFTLPERFMGRVQPRQAVAVGVSAYPDRRFDGEVYFVSPQVNESTRDFLVKATVKNPQELLKPGAFGTAVVTLEVREQRPVIPEEALVATREGYIVFVIENQIAHRRNVRVGLREAGVVEIVEGLESGERIVRAGQMNLSDGTRVQIKGDEQTERVGVPGTEADEQQ